MALNNADEAAIEQRRAKAWELRVSGKTYRAIGLALGVSPGTAFLDIKAVLERTKAETNDSVEHHRALQLSRLDKAIDVLMPMLDDPTIALDAMDRLDKLERRRSALLGLDAPSKFEGAVAGVTLDDLSEARRAAEANACSSKEAANESGKNEPSS